jgi:hypothetical protein
MQGAQKLRRAAHLRVRRNDKVAAQRRRWTFYAAIISHFIENPPLMEIVWPVIQEQRCEHKKTIMLAIS